MGTTLNRNAYQRLIDEDLAWLEKQPHSLEREHIKDIVRLSPSREYSNLATTPPDFTEQCNKCGCEYVQVGKVFTVNLDCDCDCHKNSATDLHEQARQLVEQWIIQSRPNLLELQGAAPNLVDLIASALAEAATQGQIVGIERAAQMCSDYGEEWGRQQHDEVLKAAGLELAGDIRALSPDPDYLDRVRSKAATAALEQAAQVADTYAKDIAWRFQGTEMPIDYRAANQIAKYIRALKPDAAIGDDHQ